MSHSLAVEAFRFDSSVLMWIHAPILTATIFIPSCITFRTLWLICQFIKISFPSFDHSFLLFDRSFFTTISFWSFLNCVCAGTSLTIDYRNFIKLTLVCYDATSFHPALGCLSFLRFGGEHFSPQRIKYPFFLEISIELVYSLFTFFFIA